MDLNKAVLCYKDQIINSVQENVRIPSVQAEAKAGAPFGEGVRRSLEHALHTAEKLGFRTSNLDNYIGWAEYGEGDEMIAVLGHLDVVPEGDGWSCDPYGGILRDGKIMGRGTTDDKGPSIAALYAMAALRDSGLPIRRRIRVLLGCNEETGSADISYYLSHGGEIPVMGFTPDGEYPVINGEKGIITVCFKTSYHQTAELQLLSIQGGTAPNVVPGHASAEFCCPAEMVGKIIHNPQPNILFTETKEGFRMEAFGQSAHGSTPELGQNAIGLLLIAMKDLPLSEALAKKIRFLAECIGMETDGTSAGISLHDAVSGNLSLNLGRIDGNGDSMTLWINYRYPVTFTYDDCAPKLNGCFSEAGFEILREGCKDKLYIPEDSELVTKLMKVYREQTGRREPPKCIGGGTYAKSIPNLLAFGPIFPGDELCEHKPDEYITIDSLLKNTQIIAHAMYELAK